jgi:hypothetical protein
MAEEVNYMPSAGQTAYLVVKRVSGSGTWTLTRLPTVSCVSSQTPDGTYGPGAEIGVQVVFTTTVYVTGTPQMTLETGPADAVVDYASGSGGRTLAFNYLVQPGHCTPDLDYAGPGALALNGGTIKDALANDATLELPAPGAVGSLGAGKSLRIQSSLSIVSVVPTSGRMGGSRPPMFPAVVTVRGSGFGAGAMVSFGLIPATNIAVLDSTTLTCETPSHPAGPADLTVTVPGPVSTTLPGGYSYSGWEGDVASHATLGDEDLSAGDLVQERRFVAGLDAAQSGPEFQRADVAPRSTLGDGDLTAGDLGQQRRYIAGLDPLTGAGGPQAMAGGGLGSEHLSYPLVSQPRGE